MHINSAIKKFKRACFRTRTRSLRLVVTHKKQSGDEAESPKSPRVQKKVVVKVVDSCQNSPRKSTRLQAKNGDEQKSSLDSPSVLGSKGKPSVQQIPSDSPQGRARYKRNHTEGTINGGGQRESARGADRTTHVSVTPRAKDVTLSVNTKRGRNKVNSRTVDDSSDSDDDFYLPNPKSTPTKQIIKNSSVAAKGKTPTKMKGVSKRGKALDTGASSKLKAAVENSQDLRATPTKHSGNASSDSSRTPSPCFHVWPPRNL
ncbi:unnamed protein product [Allacma fusca]|uniref:Uncharacterized protein n=1 Tax=Allacma fusca TaxID=39272 RepID=A0A8J2KHF8_9HEXA|nr:unnamed protein product [Allacma fusca]